MRHTLKSSEIFHAFVHGPQDHAKAGNLWFEGDTFYSYGSHYPLGRKVTNARGENMMLVNVSHENRGGSVSTSQHRSGLRQAVPGSWVEFEVDGRHDIESNEPNHGARIQFHLTRIHQNFDRAKRARKNGAWILEQASKHGQELNRYCDFYDLPRAYVEGVDLQQQIEAARVEAARIEADNQRKVEAKNAETIERWLVGESVTVPYSVKRAYLRVNGDTVQTSMGAEFPVTHARRGLALVEACVAKGEAYHRNGHTLHLGNYVIDAIDPDGTVRAGCHVVRFEDIQRIVPQLKEAAHA